MSGLPTVLFALSNPDRRDAVAAAISDRDDLVGTVVRPEDLADADEADCLVVDEPCTDAATRYEWTVPAVLWTERPPSDVPTTAFAGYVRADPDGVTLNAVVDEVTWVLRSESAGPKIEQLHTSAVDIVACRTEAELFDRTVEAAERVLEFDICGIDVVEDGWFVPQSVSEGMTESGYERIPADEGIAGRTYQRGETILLDDLREDPDASAAAETYRSVLSVPVGDDALFQAAAREVGAFDERDRELAELLLTHVEETLSRIRAEAARREHEAELKTERDRLAALFENVPDAVVSYEFHEDTPVVRDVNPQFEETFGYDADEVVGENIDEYVVPPDRESEAENLNRALREGERLRTTTRRQTAEGVRDFLLHVVPLTVGERSTQGYSIYTDITDQKRRERELERQNERLDEFTSIVSHDLRNPLNVASGYLEMARDSGDPEYFDRIEGAHDRMSRMIDELLSLAQQGEIVGDTRPVELRIVAHEAWQNVDTRGCSLTVDTDRVVDGDPDRLRDLLGNLFRNAVEHSSTSPASQTRQDSVEHGSTSPDSQGRRNVAEHAVDGETAEEEVSAEATTGMDAEHAGVGGADTPTTDGPSADDPGVFDPDTTADPATAGAFTRGGDEGRTTVRIGETDDGFFVADDGPGIPEDERDTVFESGYTTRKNGTGYGLAIVQQVAEAHGWTVELTDSAAGGARFEFEV
ncbi:ATP-binding protein [Halostella salina]|uniref:ATP-binding protein n=1 Tax=Halostella salina TaxID=1547897 RepID=UPI000EF7D7C1|nr:ATP-binding protein [Halostella salina]